MQKFLSRLVALSLVVASLGFAVGAAIRNNSAARPAVAASDELVALLPASDVIAVVDVSRVFGEIIPQLKALASDGGAKMAKELDEFVNETGLDPAKITSAVIGFKMSGADPSKGSGAAIVQGITLDPARIEAAVKAKQGNFKAVEYKGKQIYVVGTPERKTDEKKIDDMAVRTRVKVEDNIALVQLETGRVALGSLDGVKAVLDAKGSPATAANAPLTDTLKQTPSGLVRFALNMPPSAAQTLSSQGELFQQFAAVKMIFGSLDVSKDLSATLDARLRTGTKDEAAKLQEGLTNLVNLGKVLLGGNQNPDLQLFNQLLDQVKIGSQVNDVSLTISVPRAVFDMLAKSGQKTEAQENKQKSQ